MAMLPLQIISIIIGGPAYRDRMRLLYALDPHVDEQVILTRDDAGDVPPLHRTKILKPRLRLRGPLFCLLPGMMASMVHMMFATMLMRGEAIFASTFGTMVAMIFVMSHRRKGTEKVRGKNG